MKVSESITNSLLIEVDSLTYRLRNIQRCMKNSSNILLLKRLARENQSIFYRVNEVRKISKLLKTFNTEKFNFSSLLEEKCNRTLEETKAENNLFFL